MTVRLICMHISILQNILSFSLIVLLGIFEIVFFNFKECSRRLQFFLISNSFISNARQKLTKNQENVKQHTEAEL